MSVSGAATVNYTPTAGYLGPDSFGYFADNAGGTSANATVSINVVPLPPAPIANSVSVTVGAGSTNNPITLAITGGLPSSVAVAGVPGNGTATASGTSITYTPNPGYSGADSFTYTATNPGGTSTPALVNINVSAPAAPVANAVSATVAVDSTNNPITLNITGGTPTGVAVASAPTHGTATASGTSITYTPTPGYSGPDSFAYSATNPGGTSAPATVTLVVGANTVVIGTGAPPPALLGLNYSHALSASGGAAPYSFSLTSGALPPGITLSTGGLLAGAPTVAGTFAFTVTATDAMSYSGSRSFSITASAAIADPTLDTNVTGLLGSQTEAGNRFARAQLGNFARRIEQLHAPGNIGGFGITVTDGFGGSLGYAAPPSATQAGDAIDTALALTPQATPYNVWSAGEVTIGGVSNDELKFTTGGVSFGIDYRLNDMLTLGLGGGFGHDTTTIGGNGTKGDTSSYSLALYGSLNPASGFFLDGLLGAGALDYRSQRFVPSTGLIADGRRGGQQVFGSLSVTQLFEDGNWTLAPYGRIDAASARLDGFTETGGGAMGSLTFGSQTAWMLDAVFGLRADYTFVLEWGSLTPGVRLEYRAGTDGSSDALMAYPDLLNGPVFGLPGGTRTNQQVQFGLGADFAFAGGLNLGLDYAIMGGTGGAYAHRFSAKAAAGF